MTQIEESRVASVETGHPSSLANPPLTVLLKLSHKAKAPARAFHQIHHSSDEDLSLSPHQADVAILRRNNSLSPEELTFLQARRQRIAASGDLVKFLGLSEGTIIDERDVPVVSSLYAEQGDTDFDPSDRPRWQWRRYAS